MSLPPPSTCSRWQLELSNLGIDTPEKPFGIHKASRTEVGEVEINNVVWVREVGSESGMSKHSEWISFSSTKDDLLVECVFVLRAVAPDAWGPPHAPEFVKDTESKVFPIVVSTFRWL